MTARLSPARPDVRPGRRLPSVRWVVAGALLAGTLIAGVLLASTPVVSEPPNLHPNNNGGGGSRPLTSDLRSLGAPWAFEGLAYLD